MYHKSALEFLLDLDLLSGVGLSPTQFKKLFCCCDDCDRIVTQQSFLNHECLDQDVSHTNIEKELDIIDLSEDDQNQKHHYLVITNSFYLVTSCCFA